MYTPCIWFYIGMRFVTAKGPNRYDQPVQLMKGACLLVALMLSAVSSLMAAELLPTANVTLTWDPSPSTNVVAYRLYYGTESGTYSYSIDAGATTTVTVTNLTRGVTYYFAATAIDNFGLESDFSEEVTYTPPLTVENQPIQLAISVRPGQVQVSATATPGTTHVVQGSQDLINWVDIGSATADSAGRLQFTDADASKYQKRYYRFQ